MALVTLQPNASGSVVLTGETVFLCVDGMVALSTDSTGITGAVPIEEGVPMTIGGTLTVTYYWLEGAPAKLIYMPVS